MGAGIYHMGEMRAEPSDPAEGGTRTGDSRAAASAQPTFGAQFFVPHVCRPDPGWGLKAPD